MTVIDDNSQYTIGVVRGPSDPPEPRPGNALVIVIYVLATAALAASIYSRWLA